MHRVTHHLWTDGLTISPLIAKIGLMNNLNQQAFPPNLAGIYNEELANQLALTQGAISSLNQMVRLLHNPNLLMRPILAKEAESSSQLEGTQASLDDAYKIDVFDQSAEEKNEAQEIRNYELAMLTGLEIIKKYELNNFAIREIHKKLMQGVRGKEKHPGEFRKGEVWIGKKGTNKGSARYVPPEPVHIDALMDELEKFIITAKKLNPIIACGVIHHRFEAIHPFEDGNGRTGRLILSLYLIREGLISMPILYPSGYFEKNKEEYMDALSAVDKNEDWYVWLLYFLKGMQTQAEVALKLGLEIDDLFKENKRKIENETAGLNLIKVLEYTFTQPYVTAPIVHRETGIPLTTCKRYLEKLAQKNLIDEIGIHRRQKVFANSKLIAILKKI